MLFLFFYRIFRPFYLLISNAILNSSSISNGLVNVMIISSNSVLYVFKTLNYLVLDLVNKHKIYSELKCIILLTFADIDYLLNCVWLKRLPLLQHFVHFLHPLFFLLIVLCWKTISMFQTFVTLTYIHLMF